MGEQSIESRERITTPGKNCGIGTGSLLRFFI